jgi:D-glycero-D-manno-heptose 1,7-bisphosphate phosphatase
VTLPWATVFLDRDGTINVKAADDEYIGSADEVVLLPGAAAAIRRLNESGRIVVVVSNQRGVARGIFTRADLDEVTARLMDLLAAEGAHIDAFYYCTHERGECDCRKPLPGLVFRAAREVKGVDLGNAVLIGDAESDVGAAAAAGIEAIKIGTAPVDTDAFAVTVDLASAVEIVLSAPRTASGSPRAQSRVGRTSAKSGPSAR